MSTPFGYEQFKDLKQGPRRRELVRVYLKSNKGIRERVAVRASVTRGMVSHVLHGRAVSAPVEQALTAEETQYAHVA